MLELGQLERRHEDFARRNTRVLVVSMEGTEDAQKTKKDFPHLLILADEGRGLSEALDIVHPKGKQHREDIDYPTTILVDRQGKVRWLYRPPRIIVRLPPDELLAAIDEHIPPTRQGGPAD
jgi:peroxiredoxin